MLFIMLFFTHSAAQQYEIPHSVFGSGGGESSNNNYQLIGILGQPFIGVCENASHQSHLGFWYGLGFIVGIEEVMDNLPKRFELFQNYPNPFNPVTQIRYAVPKSSQVRLEVYNILGQRVTTLVDKSMLPGYYMVTFDVGNLASGYYFYHLQANDFHTVKKMIVTK